MPVFTETIKQVKHSSSQAGSTHLGREESGAQVLRREEPEWAETEGSLSSCGASGPEQHSTPKPTHLGLPAQARDLCGQLDQQPSSLGVQA